MPDWMQGSDPRLLRDARTRNDCPSCQHFEELYFDPEISDPWRQWFDWLKRQLRSSGVSVGLCSDCLRRAARFRDELIADTDTIKRMRANLGARRE